MKRAMAEPHAASGSGCQSGFSTVISYSGVGLAPYGHCRSDGLRRDSLDWIPAFAGMTKRCRSGFSRDRHSTPNLSRLESLLQGTMVVALLISGGTRGSRGADYLSSSAS